MPSSLGILAPLVGRVQLRRRVVLGSIPTRRSHGATVTDGGATDQPATDGGANDTAAAAPSRHRSSGGDIPTTATTAAPSLGIRMSGITSVNDGLMELRREFEAQCLDALNAERSCAGHGGAVASPPSSSKASFEELSRRVAASRVSRLSHKSPAAVQPTPTSGRELDGPVSTGVDVCPPVNGSGEEVATDAAVCASCYELFEQLNLLENAQLWKLLGRITFDVESRQFTGTDVEKIFRAARSRGIMEDPLVTKFASRLQRVVPSLNAKQCCSLLLSLVKFGHGQGQLVFRVVTRLQETLEDPEHVRGLKYHHTLQALEAFRHIKTKPPGMTSTIRKLANVVRATSKRLRPSTRAKMLHTGWRHCAALGVMVPRLHSELMAVAAIHGGIIVPNDDEALAAEGLDPVVSPGVVNLKKASNLVGVNIDDYAAQDADDDEQGNVEEEGGGIDQRGIEEEHTPRWQ